MLQSIVIKKLFGRFDYKLDFSENRIMIITGPNGYGKSTILKMINSFCSDDFSKLLSYAFSKFIVNCKTNKIEITKSEKCFMINKHSFPYPKTGKNTTQKDSSINSYEQYMSFLLNETFKTLTLDYEKKDFMEKNFSSNSKFNIFISNLIDNTFSGLNNEKVFKKKLADIKDAFTQLSVIKQEIGSVHFIQEQRLIEKREIGNGKGLLSREPEIKYVSVINENSDKLKMELADFMKRHSSLSSNLDSSYIKRLFAENSGNMTVSEFRSQLHTLQKKQEKLKKYGLADIDTVSYITKLDQKRLDRFSAELTIFLEDANAKYAVFEPIIDKLDLYEQIVNQKLTFKKIHLSSTNGIMIISDEGTNLSLNDLSSGEQEILVLFYKLIFESDVNLLLIDEPEISLHIAWQKELLDDFQNVVNINPKMQMIIATHSPQIISNNWDLQVDLGDQYNG